MNIYDVSKSAGVSIATVSRVLNGSPNVSEKTRDKVLSVMESMGYTPNIFARGLGLNTMHTIGIMCSDSSDAFLANAVYYIEQSLRKNGYDAVLCCTGYELKDKKNDLALLLSKRVDAVIMVGSHYIEANAADNAYILEAAAQVPVLMLNGYLNHPNVYCTLCDDYQAISDLVENRFRLGCHNPLFLYRSDSSSSKTKLRGFTDVLQKHGINDISEHLLLCSEKIPETKAILNEKYGASFAFDCIITAEDCLAVAALKYVTSIGKRIPRDIEIIGYNNSDFCSCTEPELSTVDNHVDSLCATSVNTLMQVLKGQDVPNKITISTDFICRGTTK